MIFSNTAARELAKKTAEKAKIKFGHSEIGRFKDGEIRIVIEEDIRGLDIIVFGCLKPPADNLLEFVLLVDAIKILKPSSITLMITYLPYSRQDKYFRGEPESGKRIIEIINSLGADRVYVVDIHSERLEQYFKGKFENIMTESFLAKHFAHLQNLIVVAPDKGALNRVLLFSRELKTNKAVLEKSRPVPNVSEIFGITGTVDGKNALIVDDMIDTGGTLLKAAEFLKKQGAKDVYVTATHGLFSDNAEAKLDRSKIKEIIVTDTIPRNAKSVAIRTVPIAEFLAEIILKKGQ